MRFMLSDCEKGSTLLKRVLENTLSAEVALADWPTMHRECEAALGNAYHQLHHYLADVDIRQRDPEYAQVQKKILQDCLDELAAVLGHSKV